jgi:hypothetical protein
MKRMMQRHEAPLDLYKAILGAYLFVSPAAIVAFREWEEWINLAIGCWVLVSPFVLGFPHASGMHVAVAVGSVVVFLSLLELWLIHNPQHANAP